jgi:hypothetical protein
MVSEARGFRTVSNSLVKSRLVSSCCGYEGGVAVGGGDATSAGVVRTVAFGSKG